MKIKRKPRKFSGRRSFRGKKVCRLCADKKKTVDYKEVDLLRRYITEHGKIIPSRISGNCASHQRKITRAIKRARVMSLIPVVGE